MNRKSSIFALASMMASFGVDFPSKRTVWTKPVTKICKSCGKEFTNRGKWCKECFESQKR
jgi:predicted amidophosphoribosyltransferase